MVPYKVIRRWAVGESSELVRGERSVRVIHRIRLFLDSGYSLIATLLFLEANSPWWFLAYCWLFSTIMPNVFTALALKSKHGKLVVAYSYVGEFIGVGLVILASGFDPTITICSMFMTSLLAANIAGFFAGWVGALGPLLFAYLGYLALGSGPTDVSIPVYVIVLYTALTFLVTIWLQSALVTLATKTGEMRRSIKQLNQQIKEQVLVRYLPPTLINDIFDGKISMDTKPHSQQITVLFSDLSGFTKMSEEHGAEVVSDFLNDYLTIMNETIFANHGTIDKFIGDAIMVIFGAPVEMSEEDQAKNAARCAIAMQQGMVLVNQKWQARGLNEVSMRIGIHQGKAVVGNFGSKQRVDYTAIGPSVNLASRIETACTPGEIYVSQEVRELLHDEPATDLAGEFELKGIEGKTSLYKLVDWG